MIKTNVKVTKRMQFALNLELWIATIVCLVAGVGMCIGYLIWNKLSESLPEGSFFLLLGVFPLIVGLGLVCVVSKNLSEVKGKNIEHYYAFSENNVLIKTETDGKSNGAFSYPYANFKRVKNTVGFFFLYAQNGSAFGIDKAKLSKEQVKTILQWIKANRQQG
jgi:high-affinity Fe2+/Pb2+ permease